MARISFARGAPSLDIVDVAGLAQAAAEAFAADPAGTTGYGTSVGYRPLRSLIAEWHGVADEQVLLTNGSMQADAFLFDELVGDGDEVVVERPSYDRTLIALRERGARLHAVALDGDGIDTEQLAALLASGAAPTLAHIIPTFQNPAGCTLSLAKRRRLLELAGEYGFTIFEDDPYVQLRFRGETLPTMFSLDGGDGRVVYASSFSKTVCPGVRVGYLVGAAPLIAAIAKRATRTYISPSMVSAAVVHQFALAGALERSITTVRTALAERVECLTAALTRHIPAARFTAPDGGYFLWLHLPDGVASGALCAQAGERGVDVVDGDDFLTEPEGTAVRLAYSGVTPAEIEVGVERLAAAVDTLAV